MITNVNESIVGEQSQSRVNSFASLSGIEPDEDAVENYITEEAKKRNKKWKLPWGFLYVDIMWGFLYVDTVYSS